MKKTIFHFFMCVAVGLFASCSLQEQRRDDSLLVQMRDSGAIGGPQRMQMSDVKTTFTYKGKEYQSSVVRRPDETLPVVSVGEEGQYYDNRITLRISCDGKQVVDKVFTKESFASLVDAKFMKYAVLEGLVYDETTTQGIIYAASVGYPQSDLYVPIRITITPDGKISMAKEELMEEVLGDGGE